jgi:DNA-binding IclR family transcriptional regulator
VFEPYKPATLGSIAVLEAESAQSRHRGIAFDRDEGPLPLACIAAPILDENNRVVASVGISTVGPLLDRPIDQQTAWIEAVERCARRIAQHVVEEKP